MERLLTGNQPAPVAAPAQQVLGLLERVLAMNAATARSQSTGPLVRCCSRVPSDHSRLRYYPVMLCRPAASFSVWVAGALRSPAGPHCAWWGCSCRPRTQHCRRTSSQWRACAACWQGSCGFPGLRRGAACTPQRGRLGSRCYSLARTAVWGELPPARHPVASGQYWCCLSHNGQCVHAAQSLVYCGMSTAGMWAYSRGCCSAGWAPTWHPLALCVGPQERPGWPTCLLPARLEPAARSAPNKIWMTAAAI